MHSNGIEIPTLALEEKDVEKGEAESDIDITSEPVRTTSVVAAALDLLPLSTLHSAHSCRDHEKGQIQEDELPAGTTAPVERPDEKAFEVGWDDESDPANPRCMKLWNKWLIVLILASCAACVYVDTQCRWCLVITLKC